MNNSPYLNRPPRSEAAATIDTAIAQLRTMLAFGRVRLWDEPASQRAPLEENRT